MHSDSLGDTLWLGTEGGIKIIQRLDEVNRPSRYLYFTDVNGMHIDSVIEPSVPFDAYGHAPEKDIFWQKVRAFVDAVKSNGPPPIPADEILFNQAICDGIYRSSKLKKEVEINIPAI
jgi:predicted dehydrogenase